VIKIVERERVIRAATADDAFIKVTTDALRARGIWSDNTDNA
jgi:hypothetical protein